MSDNTLADQKRLAVLGSKLEAVVLEIYESTIEGKNVTINNLRSELEQAKATIAATCDQVEELLAEKQKLTTQLLSAQAEINKLAKKTDASN